MIPLEVGQKRITPDDEVYTVTKLDPEDYGAVYVKLSDGSTRKWSDWMCWPDPLVKGGE